MKWASFFFFFFFKLHASGLSSFITLMLQALSPIISDYLTYFCSKPKNALLCSYLLLSNTDHFVRPLPVTGSRAWHLLRHTEPRWAMLRHTELCEQTCASYCSINPLNPNFPSYLRAYILFHGLSRTVPIVQSAHFFLRACFLRNFFLFFCN